MSTSILPLLLILAAFAILHTSMAIKCHSVDLKSVKKLVNSFETVESINEEMREKFKQQILTLLKMKGEEDCAESAKEFGMPEPTHCSSLDIGTCPKMAALVDKALGGYPEQAKGCFWNDPSMLPLERNGHKYFTPGNYCSSLEEEFGCTQCSVCNDRDFCNASLMGGPASALFLLFLAIASGTFYWTAFH